MTPILKTKDKQWRAVSILSIKGSSYNELSKKFEDEKVSLICEDFYKAAKESIENNFGLIYQCLDNHIVAIFGINGISEKHADAAISAAKRIQSHTSNMSDISISQGIDSGLCLINFDSENKSITGKPLIGAISLAHDSLPNEVYISSLAAHYADQKNFLGCSKKWLNSHTEKREVFVLNKTKPIYNNGAFAIDFIGREKEMNFLSAAYKASNRNKTSSYTWITGQAGIGKTRLINEFLSKQNNRYPIIEISFYPGSNGRDFLRQLLIEIISFTGLTISVVNTDLVDYLSHYFDMNSQQNILLKNILLHDESLNNLIPSEAFLVATILRKITDSVTIALIFEDAHWATSSCAYFLEAVTQQINKNIFLCVTSRDNVSRSLAADFNELKLTNLGLQEIRRILTVSFGEDGFSDRACERLLSLSEGNPLYITEFAKYASNNDREYFIKNFEKAEIPFGIFNLIQKQVANLNSDQQEILFLSSILGLKFKLSLFDKVFGTQIENYYSILEQMEKHNILVPLKGVLEKEYIFRHELIHRAIYEMIPSSKKQNLHKIAFLMIKNSFDSNQIDHINALAKHSFAGGFKTEAYKYNFKYAKICQKNFSPNASINCLNNCLSVLEDDKSSEIKWSRRYLRLHLYQIKNYIITAQFSLAEDLLDKMRALLKDKKLKAEFEFKWHQEKVALDWICADYSSVINILNISLKDPQSKDQRIPCLLRLAGAYSDIGDYEKSIDLNIQTLELIKENKKEINKSYGIAFPAISICYAMMARNFAWLGERGKAKIYINNALETIQKQKIQSSRIYALCFCAEALMLCGSFTQANSTIKMAKEISETFMIDILSPYILSLYSLIGLFNNGTADLKLAAKSIKIAKDKSHNCRLSLKYFYISLIQSHLGKNSEAKNSLLRSIILAKKNGELATESNAINFLLENCESLSLRISNKNIIRLKSRAKTLPIPNKIFIKTAIRTDDFISA